MYSHATEDYLKEKLKEQYLRQISKLNPTQKHKI